MFIRLKNSSLVLVVIGSMRIPICNRFQERLANGGEVTETQTDTEMIDYSKIYTATNTEMIFNTDTI